MGNKPKSHCREKIHIQFFLQLIFLNIVQQIIINTTLNIFQDDRYTRIYFVVRSTIEKKTILKMNVIDKKTGENLSQNVLYNFSEFFVF